MNTFARVLRNILWANAGIAVGEWVGAYSLPNWTDPVQFLAAIAILMVLWQLPTNRVRVIVRETTGDTLPQDEAPKRATRDDVR